MINYEEARAVKLLRLGSGINNATFRKDQEKAIEFIVRGKGRLLVVQKTGWGKSFVYFIATRLLREQGAGPALLISPLLALMRNQIEAANKMGVRAETINSTNKDHWNHIKTLIAFDKVDILIISPERLASKKFINEVLHHIAGKISLLVVDEAHCISDWGHDFRPHYRLLERIIRTLPRQLRVLATTATANNRVMDDLHNVLGANLEIIKGDLERKSLTLQTIRLPSFEDRLAWLVQVLPTLSGSGIIYTLTIRDAQFVSDWLNRKGINVKPYTGRSEDRPQLEDELKYNRVKALIATSALGMGYDKPDIGFVIHYQAPKSVVSYYQQVGRAGRNIPCAYGILLSGSEEQKINNFFIESAFPTKDEVEEVLTALDEAPKGLSITELSSKCNISRGRLEKTLQLLSLESPPPIVKDGTRWQLTIADLDNKFWERALRLTELRRAEQIQLQEYINLENGHMEFLMNALDGNPQKLEPPQLPFIDIQLDSSLVQEAILFSRYRDLTIESRKRWPNGGLPDYGLIGKIEPHRLAQNGKALCVWGDAGWYSLVHKGMYEKGQFSEELIDGMVELINRWNPQPRPSWVTCVPSTRYPELVPAFARAFAKRLSLPFMEIIIKVDQRPQQKKMANTIQQARNVVGAFGLADKPIKRPVFLIDDLVNSGWTMTYVAWLLRGSGCGEVFPLALSTTGTR